MKKLSERAADYANKEQFRFVHVKWSEREGRDDAYSLGVTTGLLRGYMAGFRAALRTKKEKP